MVDSAEILINGEISVLGRLVAASNATLYCQVTYKSVELNAVYKPIIGEEPLWDFPEGTLANREQAAFTVNQALGWDLVPQTVLRDGPYGLGMVQQWIDVDDTIDVIALAQSRDERLQAMAIFDALINNTDRKIGHLLPTSDGRLLGCDHGVTFHQQPKLRTVLWQFRGEPIPAHLLDDLEGLDPTILDPELEPLLAKDEIAAFHRRLADLLKDQTFPYPSQDWPAVPWPPI